MDDTQRKLARMEELLMVAREFITQRMNSYSVLDLGEVTVNWDDNEGDEYCLKMDIECVLDIDEGYNGV